MAKKFRNINRRIPLRRKEFKTLSEKREPFTYGYYYSEDNIKEFIKLTGNDIKDPTLTMAERVVRFNKRAGDKLITKS